MDRCSELPRRAASLTERDLHLDSGLRIEPNLPDGAFLDDELTTWVFTKELVCGELRSLT